MQVNEGLGLLLFMVCARACDACDGGGDCPEGRVPVHPQHRPRPLSLAARGERVQLVGRAARPLRWRCAASSIVPWVLRLCCSPRSPSSLPSPCPCTGVSPQDMTSGKMSPSLVAPSMLAPFTGCVSGNSTVTTSLFARFRISNFEIPLRI